MAIGQVTNKQLVCDNQVNLAEYAYLRSIDVPYIIAGDEEMDIPLALQKLKKHFGIEQVALCGGGILNGVFFKSDMIAIYPYIQGNAEVRSVIELLGEHHYKKLSAQKAEILDDRGVHLVFYPN